MPLIAIKKDKDYLRIAVASGSRTSGRIQFESAESVELAGETEVLSPTRLGEKLRAVLNQLGASKGDATVIVARSDVEMGQFQLPLVPDDELPDMVRFQARNQFTSITDDSVVDFVVLSSTETKITVLAAVLTEENLKRIHATIEPTGLKLKHIVLRPFGAAELIHAGHPDSRCRMIIEIIGREADLSVVRNDQLILSRTVRVPDSYTVEKFDAWLPGEIRRTITAAQNQLGSDEVESIVVCGSIEEHERLGQELEASFQTETRFIRPFELINKSSRFQSPARSDGFASLLGSLLRNTSEPNRGIDFANPRKRVAKKLDHKKIAKIAAVAAAFLVLGAGGIWWLLSNKQAEIARLQGLIDQLQPETQQTEGAIQNAEIIDEWKKRQIDWVEELYRLSHAVPEPDDTRLIRVTANANRIENASLQLSGLLKDSSFRDVKNRLEERPYVVRPKNITTTAEGGFSQKYVVDLFFPFPKILPNGQVVNFDEAQKKDQTNTENNELDTTTDSETVITAEDTPEDTEVE